MASAVTITEGGGLPTDVLFEVLVRLPASLVCRLRLVCRSWRSLTTDRVFATAHASRHGPLLAGVHISRKGCDVRVVDLSGNVVKRIRINNQVAFNFNTQLNMVCFSEMPVRGSRTSTSCLLNIATGEVAALIPDVHDGNASPLLLGHVPSTGEHKLFYSCYYLPGGGRVEQLCGVATLAGGSNGVLWRATGSPPALVALGSQDRVVVGGVAFFLLSQWYNQRNNYGSLEPDAIAVLDLAAEEWRPAMLQGPLSSRLAAGDEKLEYRKHRDDFRPAALNGCLVTVHRHNRYQDDASIDLWFLEDFDMDKRLWTKRYSIRGTTHICLQYASSISYPLLVLDDGRIAMWEEGAKALRAYDPRTSKGANLATLKHCFSMSMYQGNLL